jgi:hypothetical protein
MKIDAVRSHALALPEVTEQPHFACCRYRVSGHAYCGID